MENFLVLTDLILLVLAIIILVRSDSNTNRIVDEILVLRNDIQKLKQKISSSQNAPDPVVTPVAPVVEMEKPKVAEEEIEKWQRKPHEEALENIELPSIEEILGTAEQKQEAVQEKKEEVHEAYAATEYVTEHVATGYSYTEPAQPKQTFFEKNPDLEKFIGENLINKIGIAILVLGIGFFVKYAIDKDWINAIGRTCIGLLCGGALIGTAHALRKNFKAFSSVLVGGGLAVCYFTIAIAFHEYHLFSQVAAFAMMVVITGFSVLLSIAYDRQELAILAIIGGFSTPFMVSTGEGNYIVLFSYLIILNTGMLALAYFKKWQLINVISYGFTVLLYGGWLKTRVFDEAKAPYIGALAFGTAFYVIFFLMNIINNVKERAIFSYREIIILLSNTFLYYSAGMGILHFVNGGMYQGLFTASVGVFNLVFAQMLFRNKNVDKNLLYMLIGLVMTFMSLAAPVQLHGNHITLFWAAESVLLLWLSQRSGIKVIKAASTGVQLLMVISLVMDWGQTYTENKYGTLPILLNRGFITGIISLACLFLYERLLKKEKEEEFFIIPDIEVKPYRNLLSGIMIFFAYMVAVLEINYQLRHYLQNEVFINLWLGVYHYTVILIFMLFARKKDKNNLVEISTIAGIACIVSYVPLFHSQLINERNLMLSNGSGTGGLLGLHYLVLAQLIFILALCYDNVRRKTQFVSSNGRVFLWFGAIVLLFFGSAELDNIIVIINYSGTESIAPALASSHKIAYPILWGIMSFIVMVIGMNRKMRDLRIISLAIILAALVKFIFDLREASNIGRIVASICLGVLLLVISFMYQKIKRLLMHDEQEAMAHVENTEETDPDTLNEELSI